MSEKTTGTTIGKSLVIKGELSGKEDLTIDGRVEGKIDLDQNVLTVGEQGIVKADIVAKTVIVAGEVQGGIIAEKIDLRGTCRVEGNVDVPQVALALGAHVSGRIGVRGSKRE
ncbi:MAG: polymer-forming cytoskeletal protein [Acidobacteria bacterium]|nr:polymer-forming cytoskeletal protein [Acidobacteriota bacterium]